MADRTPSPQPESPEPLKVVAWGFFGPWLERRKLDWRPRNKLWEPLVLKPDAIAAIQAARNEAEAMRADAERLRSLINTPHTDDWVTASKLEAAHQIERWSAEHDAGKQPEDWFWLLGYLGGKAVAAFRAGNQEKGVHHIISSSAALLNWHRNIVGDSTSMCPGIDEINDGDFIYNEAADKCAAAIRARDGKGGAG